MIRHSGWNEGNQSIGTCFHLFLGWKLLEMPIFTSFMHWPFMIWGLTIPTTPEVVAPPRIPTLTHQMNQMIQVTSSKKTCFRWELQVQTSWVKYWKLRRLEIVLFTTQWAKGVRKEQWVAWCIGFLCRDAATTDSAGVWKEGSAYRRKHSNDRFRPVNFGCSCVRFVRLQKTC